MIRNLTSACKTLLVALTIFGSVVFAPLSASSMQVLIAFAAPNTVCTTDGGACTSIPEGANIQTYIDQGLVRLGTNNSGEVYLVSPQNFQTVSDGLRSQTEPTTLERIGSTIVSGIQSVFMTVFDILFGIIMWIPVFIAGLFFYTTAGIFDFLIDYTVINFTDLFNSFFKSGVETAWSVFRDVGNIMMIGMFVFVAFATILNSTTYGLKQFAVRIVVVAVLINFSLFFTKALVDISNFTATQFRQQIVTTNPGGQVTTGSGDVVDNGISGVFLAKAGITPLYTGASGGLLAGLGADITSNLAGNAFSKNGSNLTYVVITILTFTIAGSIFLFASILLLTRVITFVMLMLLSPLAFVAYMTPNMEKWWTHWWYTLIKNVIFAPLFMLLVWASVKILENVSPGGNFIDASSTGQFLNTEAFFNVAIAMGLLYASTKIASELSITGADWARNFSVRQLGNVLSTSLFTAGAVANAGDRLTGRRIRVGDRIRGGAEALRQGALYGNLGPDVDKALKRVASSSLTIGDSKLSKALEQATGVKGARVGFKTPSADAQADYDIERAEKGYGALASEMEKELKSSQQGGGGAPDTNAADQDKIIQGLEAIQENTAAAANDNTARDPGADSPQQALIDRLEAEQPTNIAGATNSGQQEQIGMAEGDTRIEQVTEQARHEGQLRREIEEGTDIPTAQDPQTLGQARGREVLNSADNVKTLRDAIKQASAEEKNRDYLGMKLEKRQAKSEKETLQSALRGISERAADNVYGSSGPQGAVGRAIKKKIAQRSDPASARLDNIESSINKLNKSDD